MGRRRSLGRAPPCSTSCSAPCCNPPCPTSGGGGGVNLAVLHHAVHLVHAQVQWWWRATLLCSLQCFTLQFFTLPKHSGGGGRAAVAVDLSRGRLEPFTTAPTITIRHNHHHLIAITTINIVRVSSVHQASPPNPMTPESIPKLRKGYCPSSFQSL